MGGGPFLVGDCAIRLGTKLRERRKAMITEGFGKNLRSKYMNLSIDYS
jgi:hypothetical protein